MYYYVHICTYKNFVFGCLWAIDVVYLTMFFFTLKKLAEYPDSIIMFTSNNDSGISIDPKVLEIIDCKLVDDLPHIPYVKLSIMAGMHEIYLNDVLRNKQHEAEQHAYLIFEKLSKKVKEWHYVKHLGNDGQEIIFND
jgi:hypothetical protein